MIIMGNGNDYRIAAAAFDEFVTAVEILYFFAGLGIQFLGYFFLLFKLFRQQICDCGTFAICDCTRHKASEMAGTHVAGADNTEFYFFHLLSSPFLYFN